MAIAVTVGLVAVLPSGVEAGSLGEWVSGVGTFLAVVVASRQFVATGKENTSLERRTEALKISSWVEYGKPDTDDYEIVLANAGRVPIYAWQLHLVPAQGWDVHFEQSSQFSVLAPESRLNFVLDAPVRTAVVDGRRRVPAGQAGGSVRFLCLEFADAWGDVWVRANSDLQQVPRQSRYWDRVVHLRSSGMTWAGVIDEAVWAVFVETVGHRAGLSPVLSDLFKDCARWMPRTGPQGFERYAELVCGLPRPILPRRAHVFVHTRRGVERTIQVDDAYRQVTRFFRQIVRGQTGTIMLFDRD
ncbi:hypothetical protein [Kineosporia babensis]|uniref:Uncharacterized protein n=1 Tax=Kineosporia babensis TaxID=499548 RepID=A0A9X1SW70_9ACTN|nr:hypothetical protein [Kineosporia babensis]MCD5314441.1 hypothetical protein [Kineosporia babensis]